MICILQCHVVYGFFDEAAAQVEQGPGYMVRVGYVKGAHAPGATTLVFDVQNTQGTASKLNCFKSLLA